MKLIYPLFLLTTPLRLTHTSTSCKILTLPSAVTSGANRPNCYVGTCHFQYFMWVGMGGDGWMVIKGQRFSKSTFGAKNIFFFISSQLQIAKVEMDVERFRVSVQWLQHPEQGDKDYRHFLG